jgi:hypothetical protein
LSVFSMGTCTINVEFDVMLKQEKIESNDYMHYHGAACHWEGQLVTKEKAHK